MFGAAAAILLCLLPSQVNGLITTQAKCLSGNEWLYSSIGQSPCDVAAELATVCSDTTYQVLPLSRGSYYLGPWAGYRSDNNCLCSSVYYSLLSACSYCQGEDFLFWSSYTYNCTNVHLAVYPYPIPVGVRVPGYAYQDVTVYNQFNVTVAYRVRGIESSRALPPSTQSSTPTSSLYSSATATSSGGGGTTATSAAILATKPAYSPSMVGGVVVGGLVGVGLVAALIIFLVLRSRQKSRSQNYNSSFQQSPDMAVTPDTATSLIHSGIAHNPKDQSTYPSDMSDLHGPSSNPNLTPHFTGNSTQNHAPPQAMPPSGRYFGMPEV